MGKCLLFILLFLPFFNLSAQPNTLETSFHLNDLSDNYQFLYSQLTVFKEEEKRLSIEEILANQQLFQPNQTADNFQAEEIYWAKLVVHGVSDTTSNCLLFIESYRHPYSWQYIDVWVQHEDGKLSHQQAGLALEAAEKSIPSHLNLAELSVAANEKMVVYARLEKGDKNRRFKKLGIGIIKDHRGNNRGYQSDRQFPYTSTYSPFKASLITSHEFYEDPTGTATIQEVSTNWANLPRSYVFITPQQTEKVYWLKQRFLGSNSFQGEQIFYLNYYDGNDYYSFDYMDTYILDKSGKYSHQRAGDKVALKDRAYDFWANLIKLNIGPTDTLDMYVRLEGADWRALMPFMGLWHVDKDSFWEEQSKLALREGAFFGILLIQACYSFFLFLIGKERLQLYLSLFILGIFITFGFITNDSIHLVFFPTLKDWSLPMAFIGQFLVAYALLQFTKTYFAYEAAGFTKWFIPAYLLVFALLVLDAVFQINLMNGDFYYNSASILLIISVLIGFYMIYATVGTSMISKAFYLIAFLPVAIAFLIFAITNLGGRMFNITWLSGFDSSFIINLLQASIVLMLMLLGLSTGHRTNQLKAETAAALKQNLVDQQQINQTISKFVPNQFLQALGKNNISQISLGDHAEKTVTVFFSDIRGYTAMAEQMTPTQTFSFVNAFNSRLGPLIQQNKGFVNQYLGDGIMAIFPPSTEHALRAAIQMQQTIRLYNEERKEKNRPVVRVGMGMHTGSLVMGIIGDHNRLDPATISDTVNTAARIESLTKHYQASILLSEASLQALTMPEEFNFRYLGQVQVKGKQQIIKIYECFDGNSSQSFHLKIATLANFESGIQHYYNKEFVKSATALEAVMQQNPLDLTAQLYLQKVQKLIASGVEENWSGVDFMFQK